MTALAASLGDVRALRFVREPPARIAAVVVVGSTCAGKTTLVAAVRAAAFVGVDVPRRFVTRAPRGDDVADEAGYVTFAELDASIAAGTIGIHWTRMLEPGRIERYAFARAVPGTLPVYSANNAICIAENVQPPGALADALFVGVHAPDGVRERRLRARSPALWRDHPAEARARLAEPADSMIPYVHVVIENHGELEPAATHDMVTLVTAVRSLRA
jgi:ribose 1,5-bisphosphokinase PhnN